MAKVARGYANYVAQVSTGERKTKKDKHGRPMKASRALHARHIEARDKAEAITKEYNDELKRKKAKHGN